MHINKKQSQRVIGSSVDALEIIYMPVSILQPEPINFGNKGQRIVAELKKIIRRGKVMPPVVAHVSAEGFCTVLVGNHRLAAARALGYDTIPSYLTYVDDFNPNEDLKNDLGKCLAEWKSNTGVGVIMSLIRDMGIVGDECLLKAFSDKPAKSKKQSLFK